MTYIGFYARNQWSDYDIYECNNDGFLSGSNSEDYHIFYFNYGWHGDWDVDFFDYEIRQPILPKEVKFINKSDLKFAETIHFLRCQR